MSREDKGVKVDNAREYTTEEYSFDNLAKGLAGGTISRGRALKLMAGAILGGGVLTLLPGVARAVETDASQGCPNGQRAINDNRCPTNSCSGRERGCRCAETVNGNNRCVKFNRVNQRCKEATRCNSNSDCASDEVCIKAGGCCGDSRHVCAKTCSL